MNFREAIAILKNKGYTLDRVKGSHHIFVKEGQIIPSDMVDLRETVIRLMFEVENGR